MTENQIATTVVDCAYQIHVELGPGLMETVYEAVLKYELIERGLKVRSQVPVPIEWKGVRLPKAYVADMIIEEMVIIELKSVTHIRDIHSMQLLSYLKLTGLKLGLLLNFGDTLMKNGIKRLVNRL